MFTKLSLFGLFLVMILVLCGCEGGVQPDVVHPAAGREFNLRTQLGQNGEVFYIFSTDTGEMYQINSRDVDIKYDRSDGQIEFARIRIPGRSGFACVQRAGSNLCSVTLHLMAAKEMQTLKPKETDGQ